MSGKRARQLRKSNKISKKTLAMGFGLCMSAIPLAANGEFLVSLYPNISKPFGPSHKIESGIGGGAKITYRPFDFLNVFAYGDYLSLALPNIDSISLVDGGVGTGYHLGITDHVSMDFNLQLGAYSAKANKRMSGITGGVNLTFTYRLNPVMSADVNASASHFASGSSPLMTLNAGVSPGLTLNITELFSNKAKLGMQEQELTPVFPVLYSWYENNPFGTVKVTNNEDSSITDITVSFYQPQYMGQPKECAKIESLSKGESTDVDLYAFFNEQMLELTEKTDTHATVIVEYSCLGQKRTQKFSMVIPVYGRNNMSWDDDRRAAVFVSSKDPAAMLFAKYVTSVVRDNVRNGVPENIQYAMGIFEALDQFGLSYVIDPTSAFTDNVGTSAIDFLQFPYQTLMYRGGDCDDLSILVCSLFEAVGIRTAFITVPGHIFMAFDSGLTPGQAQREYINLSEMIIDNNEVWVPLEITLSDEGFYKAWKVGAREWNSAYIARSARMYRMEDSWKTYAPVNVPGANAFFTMPDRKIVAKLFDHSVDQWITKQIEPQIAVYEAKLSVKDDVQTRNSLGVLYGKYGLFVKADEQFKLARRQGYIPSILNTGNIYFSMQDYDRARRWYKSVLKDEPENVLALIGVARCSYELTEYKECDAAYKKVMQLDPELALEYAYLGTFVSSKGRAFSLADRLQNTIWSEEEEEVPQMVQEIINTEPEETKQIITEEPINDTDLDDMFDFSNGVVALAPQTEVEEEEDLEDYDIASAAGDGDPNKKTEINLEPELTEDPEVPEVSENLIASVESADSTDSIDSMESNEEIVLDIDISIFTESFTGLASEVALNINDFIYEDISEVEVPAALLDAPVIPVAPVEPVVVAPVITTVITPEEEPSVIEVEPAVVVENEIAAITEFEPEPDLESDLDLDLELESELKFESEPELAQEKNPLLDIVPMEVPRFTEQPSAQWAPEEAYLAEVIPGMRSFEEEMGEYQNEKSFLYEGTAILETDPDNDVDQPEIQQNAEMYASAGVPDVNPFSSYLSKEDAKIVEEITNYKLEEKPAAVVVKTENIPVSVPVAKTTEVEKISVVETEKAEVKNTEVEEKPVVEVETTENVNIQIPEAESKEAEDVSVTETEKSEVENIQIPEVKNTEVVEKTVVETKITENVNIQIPETESKEAEDVSITESEKIETENIQLPEDNDSEIINTPAQKSETTKVENFLVPETKKSEIETIHVSEAEKTELKETENTEKTTPKGLLAVIGAVLVAGIGAVVITKKTKSKKDKE